MSSSSDRKNAGGLNDSDETIRSYVCVDRMVAELSVLEEVGVPLKILRKVAMESQLYRRGVSRDTGIMGTMRG